MKIEEEKKTEKKVARMKADVRGRNYRDETNDCTVSYEKQRPAIIHGTASSGTAYLRDICFHY